MALGVEFQPIIKNIFGDIKNYGQEQLQVNCPKCQERDGLLNPDGKYNLEINTAKRVFHCWKCQDPPFKGTLGKLVRKYGTKADYQIYLDYAQLFDDFSPKTESNYEDIIITLPKEMIPFSSMDENNIEHLKAINYLILERGMTKETILKYRLGFCTEGYYGGRIIIPSFDKDGEVNYFQSRAYRKGLKPKMLNPKLNKKKVIVNEGLLNWDSTIYIVEGGFDYLSIPFNSTPLLGKTLGDALYRKLKEEKPNVVIILDPDAFKDALEIFYTINSIYAGIDQDKVRIVKLKGENDIDEIRKKYGRSGVIKKLRTARRLIVDDFFYNNIITESDSYENRERRKRGFTTY